MSCSPLVWTQTCTPYVCVYTGRTVHNALWMHFPQDTNTFAQDGQFMWSDGLLFTPVLTQGATTVRGYFPAGLWFSLFTDECIESSGIFVELETPLLNTNAHVRGGTVVPMQEAAMTTAAVTSSPYTLLVALSAMHEATGGVFVDDGKQLEMEAMSEVAYSVSERVLVSEVVVQTYQEESPRAVLGAIEVWQASSASVSHCDGYITVTSSSDHVKVLADDLSIANFENFSRMKFSFKGMDLIQNFEFHWECQ